MRWLSIVRTIVDRFFFYVVVPASIVEYLVRLCISLCCSRAPVFDILLFYFIASIQVLYCFSVLGDTLPTVRSLTLPVPPSLRLYRSLPRGNKEQCPFKNQFGTDPPPPTPTAILFCHRIRARASERWGFRGENNIFSTWVVP